MNPDIATRLATYGTLRPGRSNHGQVSGLGGTWIRGTVRGILYAEGWGAAQGYPGLVLAPEGDPVEVDLLQSDALPDHWAQLDAFEGEGYVRVTTTVKTAEGPVDAWIYELVPAARGESSSA